ncbi:MAG: GatB/YqeY domain-containing protein [Coriobacteriales bacterium]|jgi:uncharacterized protein YqeY|nr:GatB/YqeY domain-containing protein [Coriobacteriales bacterium]
MDRDTLDNEIKAAMRGNDRARLSVLRLVSQEVKNIEIDERREVSDADVDAMLKRVLKQTRETLEGSIKAANDDERTALLASQVKILEGYLPQQLSGDALIAAIEGVLAETGATAKKDMGRVMGVLTQQTGGNFDKAAAVSFLGTRLA